MNPKDYYRPDELARLLDVSTDTVRRWIRCEIIVHIHLPKGARIPHQEYLRIKRDGVMQTHTK